MLSLSRPLPRRPGDPHKEITTPTDGRGFCSTKDRQRIEETVDNYLKELIDRNSVQVVAVSTIEKIKKCWTHDIVRDLSIKKANEENFFDINIVSPPSTS